MLRYFITSFFLFLGINSFCQANQQEVYIQQLLENAWQKREAQPKEAEKLALLALDLSSNANMQVHSASANNYLGLIYRNMNRNTEAITHFKYAYSLRVKLGNLQGAANVLGNLGTAYRSEENYTLAIQTQLQGLSVHEDLKDSVGISDDLIELANTYEYEGTHIKMRNFFLQCLDLSILIGYEENIAKSQYGLASYYIHASRPDSAKYWAQQTLSTAIALDDKILAIKANGLIADAYMSLGDTQNAGLKFYEIIKQLDTIKDISPSLQYSQLNNYAVYLNDNNQSALALEYLNKAERLLGSAISLEEQHTITFNKANTFVSLGKLDSALYY
jgi:tetratricopeptide (TPR) repeat protein